MYGYRHLGLCDVTGAKLGKGQGGKLVQASYSEPFCTAQKGAVVFCHSFIRTGHFTASSILQMERVYYTALYCAVLHRAEN